MSLFKDLISSIEPSASGPSPAPSPIQRLPPASPKLAQRPAGSANGASATRPLKRKASGPIDSAQIKIQRKEALSQPGQTNAPVRAAPPSGGVKASPTVSTTPTSSVPYRGTAGLGSTKSANAPLKKPNPQPSVQPKAAVAAPRPTASKPAGVPPGSAASAPAKKTGGYMAMLQKAKERDQSKPTAPPIKHEPTKIMTKKDRERARLEAKAASKGKKASAAIPAKASDGKVDAGKEKRKPVELGYQGTARPAKKPVDLGYKGTARPTAAAGPAGRPGATSAASKAKPKPNQGRYGGYASWSDEELDGEEEEEEEDYASDMSSDMEGGLWDVEEEESRALKAAKQEDAEALAEENELKRQKEERKRKLMAMNKAAAGKRKY